MNNMTTFIVNALNLLAEVPGVPSGKETEWPYRSLDTEAVLSAYQALSGDDQALAAEPWRALQALIEKQQVLQREASRLSQTFADQLIRTLPYDAQLDEFLRHCLVQRDLLAAFIEELPPASSRALLLLAQWLREHANSAEKATGSN